MSAPVRRNVTPLMHRMRNILLQRDWENNNRFPDQMAPRDQPTPRLPEGISHQLSANYYYSRDGRRGVRPNKRTGEQLQLTEPAESSGEGAVTEPSRVGVVLPGFGLNDETGGPAGPSPFHK